MLGFINRHRNAVLALLVIAVLYVVFSLHFARRTGKLPWHGRALLFVMSPLQRGATGLIDGVVNVWSRYLFLVGVVEENQTLRRRVMDLELRNEALLESAIQERELREVLELRAKVDAPVKAAEIIALDLSSQFQMVRIGIGKNDGVALGMPVLGKGGLVGQIFRVGGSFSDVLLLTDRNSVLDVVVQRSRARGIVAGAGRRAFRMRFRYLSSVEDVKLKDIIVTSGEDGVFPPGLQVGMVTDVSNDETGVLQNAEVQPSVDFGKLDQVLVVLRQDRPAFPEGTHREDAAER